MKRIFVLCILVLVLLQGCSVPPIKEMVKVLNWFYEHGQRDDENQNSDNKKTYIICIDPGHQRLANYDLEALGPGSDIQKPKVSKGAIGVSTAKEEYVLTLEVSLKLKDRLEALGYQVVLTRQNHDVDISNKERALMANEHGADLFIRIHADQNPSKALKGISILSPSKDNHYTESIYQESSKLAELVLQAMLLKTGAHDMGISYRGDISGFNWSEVPVVLVEVGFMSNPEEDIKLSDSMYQDKLVEGMVEGIQNYFVWKAEDEIKP